MEVLIIDREDCRPSGKYLPGLIFEKDMENRKIRDFEQFYAEAEKKLSSVLEDFGGGLSDEQKEDLASEILLGVILPYAQKLENYC